MDESNKDVLNAEVARIRRSATWRRRAANRTSEWRLRTRPATILNRPA